MKYRVVIERPAWQDIDEAYEWPRASSSGYVGFGLRPQIGEQKPQCSKRHCKRDAPFGTIGDQ
jgi:hypothetical protein